MDSSFSPGDRLTARYGQPVPWAPRPDSDAWNATLDALLAHRSVRKWLDRPVDEEQLLTVIAAAQSAPSSSNKQAVSVIAVEDPDLRRQLAGVGKQMSSHIEHAPVTLVWLIDFSRGRFLAHREQAHPSEVSGGHGTAKRVPTDLGALEYIEEPMMAVLDIGIAAQNAAVAAESLGLGTVFLGSLRNDIDEVRRILGIPEDVVPFVGLEIGHPDPTENAGVKPRLPMDLFLHRDRYNQRDSAAGTADQTRLLGDYDDALGTYYSRYGSHPRWSHQLLNRLTAGATEKSKRRLLRDVLRRAGFGLR
jgi:nitroreductase